MKVYSTKNEYVSPTLGPPNDHDVIAKVLPMGKLISEAAGVCPWDFVRFDIYLNIETFRLP
jgi:hypothetical protein